MSKTFIVHERHDAPWEPSDAHGLPGGTHRVYKSGADDGIQGIIGTFPPGFVEPAHTHDDVDHWCVVIEGEMHVDGKVLGPGSYIYAPRGVCHGPFHYPVGATIFATVRGPGAFTHEFDTPAGVRPPA